jgi:hypothetical protein
VVSPTKLAVMCRPSMPITQLAADPLVLAATLVALSSAAACGVPQHRARTAPPSVRLSAPPGWRKVVLLHERISSLTFIAAGRISRLDLGHLRARAPRRRVGAFLGTARSADVSLTAGELAEVRCAFEALTWGASRDACGARDRRADRAEGQQIVTEALGSLRRQVAVGGARVVDRVRCFVEANHRGDGGPRRIRGGLVGRVAPLSTAGRRGGGRLWCEGRAHR